MKLIILQGPPACGKSTWVKNYLESLSKEEREKTVVVSRDEIRKSTGTYWVPSREDYITELEDAAMRNAFKHDLTVINDATNLNPKTLTHLREIATECGAQTEYVPLYVPFKEAVERDRKRGEQGGLEVTKNVIKGFYQRYFPDRLADELYVDHRYVLPMKYPRESVVICDLDGTVAIHKSGRSPFDYERVGEDTPLEPMVDTLRRLADGGAKIAFVTGREKVGNCEEKTKSWIVSHVMGTRPFELYMREKHDHRHGYEVKQELAMELIKKYNIINIFEDDPRCVKMYRDMGLQCSQAYDFDVELDCAYFGKKDE